MTNCLNRGVQLTKNCRCANLVCLNQGVHPTGVCRNIALLSLKSVSESANDEVLLQRRRPVKNGRVIFQKALPWLQHQKLVSIFSDGILIHRGIWNQSGGE